MPARGDLTFIVLAIAALWYLLWIIRRKPSQERAVVDAVVPAYNEEICIENTLTSLLENRYVRNVICVNDGSTDGTAKVLDRLAARKKWQGRLKVVHQENTGKGGALMNGIRNAQSELVLLTDADTFMPNDDSIGYLLAEIEAGADAVGGVCDVNLTKAGWLPYMRASIKLPMLILRRGFQQLLGGSAFIISGACGLFKRDVVLACGFSDRTKVEDLDLSWTLVKNGYKVRLAPRCIAYTQECLHIRDEWKKYKRWIAGYAVCMRLHKDLLLTRFGLCTIMPMVWVVFFGVASWLNHLWNLRAEDFHVPLAEAFLYKSWLLVLLGFALFQSVRRRNFWLLLASPLSIPHLLMTYAVWVTHGLYGLITGKEPSRDKPTRYAQMVGKIGKRLRMPGSLCVEVHRMPSGNGHIALCVDSATKWLFALHVPDASQASLSLFFQRLCQSCAVKIRRISILDNAEGKKLQSNPDVQKFCRILRTPCRLVPQHKCTAMAATLLQSMDKHSPAEIPDALRHHVYAYNHLKKNSLPPAERMRKWHARHPHLFVMRPTSRKVMAYA